MIKISAGDLYNPTTMTIEMDGSTVCDGISSMVAGVTVLMAVYYVYGVQYPKGADNTLFFIQQYLMKLDTESKKPPNTVLRLAGAIL